MEQEQIEEWGRLREEALKRLRAGSDKQNIGLLYMLLLPTWEPSICDEIYKTQRQRLPSSFCVAVTLWRCKIDAAKLATPIERLKYPRTITPTLESQSFEITAKFVNGILGKFKAVSIPTLPNTEVIGLEGRAYEVGLGDGFVWSRFHWWESPPPEWQPLSAVFQDTYQEIEKLIATKREGDIRLSR